MIEIMGSGHIHVYVHELGWGTDLQGVVYSLHLALWIKDLSLDKGTSTLVGWASWEVRGREEDGGNHTRSGRGGREGGKGGGEGEREIRRKRGEGGRGD